MEPGVATVRDDGFGERERAEPLPLRMRLSPRVLGRGLDHPRQDRAGVTRHRELFAEIRRVHPRCAFCDTHPHPVRCPCDVIFADSGGRRCIHRAIERIAPPWAKRAVGGGEIGADPQRERQLPERWQAAEVGLVVEYRVEEVRM